MIGCVYDYTKKYLETLVEPNISRERDTKKKRLRARNARFSGAENTRENPRARGDGDDDNTYHNQTRYDLKYDLKKPSEPEEKERGREFFFVSLCPRESSFWIQREREREKEKEKETRTSAMML
jgi:hypothetical protein